MTPSPSELEDVVVHVVDDDDDLRESLVWLLGSVGIQVKDHPDADSFFAAYDESRPACVVVDVRMPVVSGFQVQERLNALESPAPVIFCSAHGDIQMSVRALQRGAVTFLEKPYEPQQMIDVVQEGLSTAVARFRQQVERRDVVRRLSTLTQREREVLRLVVTGLPSQNIARRLGTSVKTIDVHRARIRVKTDAESIATLVRDVLSNGIDV
ncbi:FixJ family two-component response regulator [Kribbella sp. VKM Ac-2527]|uniref:FixJ family two-component response regulator n=1 Tax=Kribbella caucasensis TaxID=2512215 RepID=A0A4R6KCQ2_9ACTN|nr:response regulator [Kribbella sp. VKM Ac-2527]TDO48052.1 FixJ family two-component response regulator [Kribbella sp. VKM Ac-2527]